MHIIAKSLSSSLILLSFTLVLCDDHWSQREEVVSKEKGIALGAKIKLRPLEECVNQGLMSLKYNELDQALENPSNFYPSVNFLKAVKYIDTSDVYNFIRKMPKGAALHLHDTAMASPQYLYKLTYTENLFVCWTKTNRLLLNFFLFHVDNRCEWIPLEIAREEEGFEELLQSQLSMATSVYKATTSSQVAWNELLGTFATIEGLISYKPIFTTYLSEVLNRLYEDNVMYVELRTMLLPVYDLEGNDYNPSDVATILKEVLEDFKCSHEDFLGGKIIYTPSRMAEYAWMDRYMEIMEELSSEHPNFVAGFDLMGQEDLSYPLSQFVGALQGMRNRVSFFFSAGETNWIGSTADVNMYDAILLRPARIGHAFTLFSHPEILKMVKKQNIAIELCPISNQMMMLVNDLRNHPGKFLISQGYPVVISSDNPGFWGARTLSHDWYVTFMAMADRHADLKLLKQLAINSLQYSAVSDKKGALKVWSKKWNDFIKKMEYLCIEDNVEQFNETGGIEPPEIDTESNTLETPTDTTQEEVQEITTKSKTTIEEQITDEVAETESDETEETDETTLTSKSVDQATDNLEVSPITNDSASPSVDSDTNTVSTSGKLETEASAASVEGESIDPTKSTEVAGVNTAGTNNVEETTGDETVTEVTAETVANSVELTESGATEGAGITAESGTTEELTTKSETTGEEGMTTESGATGGEGVTTGSGATGGEGVTVESAATEGERITGESGATGGEGIVGGSGATTENGAGETAGRLPTEGANTKGATAAGEVTGGDSAKNTETMVTKGADAVVSTVNGHGATEGAAAAGSTIGGDGVTKQVADVGITTSGPGATTTISGKTAKKRGMGTVPIKETTNYTTTNQPTTIVTTASQGAKKRAVLKAIEKEKRRKEKQKQKEKEEAAKKSTAA